jgi:hypothetical protein
MCRKITTGKKKSFFKNLSEREQNPTLEHRPSQDLPLERKSSGNRLSRLNSMDRANAYAGYGA